MRELHWVKLFHCNTALVNFPCKQAPCKPCDSGIKLEIPLKIKVMESKGVQENRSSKKLYSLKTNPRRTRNILIHHFLYHKYNSFYVVWNVIEITLVLNSHTHTYFGVSLPPQVTRKLREALKYAVTPEDFMSTQWHNKDKAYRR